MSGWTKLFSSIVTSSIWVEDDSTLRAWVAMLATADADGVVEGSVPGFANLARVTADQMRLAVTRLSSPDPESRTPDFDGRRIEVIEGGWRILNYRTYRDRGQAKDGSKAPAMRKYRARKRAESLHELPKQVTSELEERGERKEERKDHVPPSEVARARFERFWDAYPRKTGKDAAWKEWLKRSPSNDLTDAMIGKVHEQRASTQWLKDAGEYIPHPRTWLHQGRWQDEISIAPAPALMSPEEREQRRNAAKYGAGGAR